MRLKHVTWLGALLLLPVLLSVHESAIGEERQSQFSRIAEIEIDPQQLEAYKAALSEGIEAAIRLEPGVITLYAVSFKDHPEQIRVFEVYASRAAYQTHLETPHFKRCKATTRNMVLIAQADRN